MADNLDSSILTPDWDLPEGVSAFYSKRTGGYSQDPYDSNNLALHVGDEPHDVYSNRESLPLNERIAWLNQVHSSRCVNISDEYFLSLEPAKADASFTIKKSTICAVLTADCVPLLLVDNEASCVAAIHAGWRGLANGVIQNTIAAMPASPESLRVWVGPHISQANFQVGDDVKHAFEQYPHAFMNDSIVGKYRCSLIQIIESILHSLNVNNLTHCGICTYEQHDTFFSYRYEQKKGDSRTGRFISGIYLNN